MAEEMVWRGTSSQWKNFGRYALALIGCVIVVLSYAVASRAASPQLRSLSPYLLILLVVPLFIAFVRYLETKTKVYELTTERIKISRGILSKVTDTLELYRVKDLETRQPFLYRVVGIENVQLNTSDASSPFVLVHAVPGAVGLGDKIRNQVEIIRRDKAVREIDVE
ncbi:MAG: PH domain-containing protein [Chthoniobacterales bacterium]